MAIANVMLSWYEGEYWMSWKFETDPDYNYSYLTRGKSEDALKRIAQEELSNWPSVEKIVWVYDGEEECA